jgi:hypothetical protein
LQRKASQINADRPLHILEEDKEQSVSSEIQIPAQQPKVEKITAQFKSECRSLRRRPRPRLDYMDCSAHR